MWERGSHGRSAATVWNLTPVKWESFMDGSGNRGRIERVLLIVDSWSIQHRMCRSDNGRTNEAIGETKNYRSCEEYNAELFPTTMPWKYLTSLRKFDWHSSSRFGHRLLATVIINSFASCFTQDVFVTREWLSRDCFLDFMEIFSKSSTLRYVTLQKFLWWNRRSNQLFHLFSQPST